MEIDEVPRRDLELGIERRQAVSHDGKDEILCSANQRRSETRTKHR